MRLTPQEAEELYQLRGNKTLVRYLELGLTETQETLLTCRKTGLVRLLQGRGQAFKELLSHVRDGPKSAQPGKSQR